MELVILARQRGFGENFRLSVAGEVICSRLVVRYLGMWIDSQLTFGEHIRRAADEAAGVSRMLLRLMPNVGGPREVKRRLLASVFNSILLYGTEVWVDAFARKDVRERLTLVQRIGSIRIAFSYRTVSSAAAIVIAQTIFVVLLARERRRKFLGSSDESDSDRHEETLMTWQQEWGQSVVGRWMQCLLPHLRPWEERGHGEVNYHLTQFLFGLGQFDAYLHHMAVKALPRCSYCPALDDTFEYTFFVCERWHRERQQLVDKISVAPTSETIILEMLSS
ncbi:uncharacterized protein LOC106642739 [Copidosoma floridanum]|uniref:uncharacterized protein LOC106642739 n=1 Tax=Copidosoma floridanum TaxID=29053 RepID=UPI0006C96A5E|nr:uncharacterized protein LOC106642739 [Copidosoma floridanum]